MMSVLLRLQDMQKKMLFNSILPAAVTILFLILTLA